MKSVQRVAPVALMACVVLGGTVVVGGTGSDDRLGVVGDATRDRDAGGAEDRYYDFEPNRSLGKPDRVVADPHVLVTGESLLEPRRRAAPRKLTSDELVLPRNPITGEATHTGRVLVKFADWTKARASASVAPFLQGMVGGSAVEVDAIAARHGAMMRQWLQAGPDELEALTRRAGAVSGRPQPDLACIVAFEADEDSLLPLAQELNALDYAEWVEFERWVEQAAPQEGLPNQCNPPACPGPFCDQPCNTGDLYGQLGQLCGLNPDPGGNAQPRPCYRAGCLDAGCFDQVVAVLPTCGDTDNPRGWDAMCAAIANVICEGTIYDTLNPGLPPSSRYDPCLVDPQFTEFRNWLTGDCFQARPGQAGGNPRNRGCNKPGCCAAVCDIDPLCCVLGWDAPCVDLASQLTPECTIDANGIGEPTPDFTAELVEVQENTLFGPRPALRARGLQAYTVGAPVLGWQRYVEVPPPPYAAGQEFLASGFRGWGLDLQQMRELAVSLADRTSDPDGPLLDGEGIRVGLIDLGCLVDHEEFTCAQVLPGDPLGTCVLPYEVPRVIPEAGQTQIDLTATEIGHGTACMGMLVAGDNGFGVTGIAKAAQGYFYPIVSQEQGFRLGNAMVSMLEDFASPDVEFGLGSVAVIPLAVAPDGGVGPNESSTQPLTIVAQWYTLLRLATDLGVTCVIPAGNSCSPIGAEADPALRSGAIVVGAANPGSFREISPVGCSTTGSPYSAAPGPFSRCPSSNFIGGDGDGGVVDCFGWGLGVATTGGLQDLFVGQVPPAGDSRRRAYTDTFGGTSAASSMIAGGVAVLQAFSIQRYGIPMQPERLAQVVRNNGIPQAGRTYDNIFGFPGSDIPCQPDWAIGQQVRRIGDSEFGRGVFPQLVEAANDILYEGGPCEVVEIDPLPPQQISLTSAGVVGNDEITVTMNSDVCTWYAFTDADWIDITTPSGSGADGGNRVVFTAEPNFEEGPRTSQIFVSAGLPYDPVAIDVVQDSCQVIDVQPAGLNVVVSPGGDPLNEEIVITLDSEECLWTAFGNASWLELLDESGTGAKGDNVVGFQASLNDSGGPRTATIIITVGGTPILVTVTQDPAFTDLDNYVVYTGTEVTSPGGGRFVAADAVYSVIEPTYVAAGTVVDGLAYQGTGQTSDVKLDIVYDGFDPGTPNNNVAGLGVCTYAFSTLPGVTRFVYILNRNTGQYFPLTPADEEADSPYLLPVLGEQPPPPTLLFALNPFIDPSPYIDQRTGLVTVRIWTLGLGATGSHLIYHDYVNVGPPLLVPEQGCGG